LGYLTFDALTESAISIHEMGEGQLILSQINELTGKPESIALSFSA